MHIFWSRWFRITIEYNKVDFSFSSGDLLCVASLRDALKYHTRVCVRDTAHSGMFYYDVILRHDTCTCLPPTAHHSVLAGWCWMNLYYSGEYRSRTASFLLLNNSTQVANYSTISLYSLSKFWFCCCFTSLRIASTNLWGPQVITVVLLANAASSWVFHISCRTVAISGRWYFTEISVCIIISEGSIWSIANSDVSLSSMVSWLGSWYWFRLQMKHIRHLDVCQHGKHFCRVYSTNEASKGDRNMTIKTGNPLKQMKHIPIVQQGGESEFMSVSSEQYWQVLTWR